MPSRAAQFCQTGSGRFVHVCRVFPFSAGWVVGGQGLTRAAFLGRGGSPLCGRGVDVLDGLDVQAQPACRAVMADSRPEPGPLTRTSISFRPNFDAFSAAISGGALGGGRGVLLRLPLKPTVPRRRGVAQGRHRCCR